MIGVLVNTVTVIIGSTIGLLLKRGIPKKISEAVMFVIGLCALYIGIDGALEGNNAIVLIVSMVVGTIIGELIDIDRRIEKLGEKLESKFSTNDKKGSVSKGFLTGSLLFCVGSMTIVGSINSGLLGDNELIFTKSVMDLISSCMLASALGIGVLFAGAFVFVFQGLLVISAGLLKGVLTDPALLAEITCAGSVMIIGLGLNLLGLTKLKIANMLPALPVVPLVYYLVSLIPIL